MVPEQQFKISNKDYITGDIKKKILGTKDLSYTGEFGLQELLDRSEDLLSEEEVAQEKKQCNIFHNFRDNPKNNLRRKRNLESSRNECG